MTNYDWEQHADIVIERLGESIHLEDQFVKEAHDIEEKLQALDNVLMHINERIAATVTELHRADSLLELNKEVADVLLKIRELIETGRLHNLQIVREEEYLLNELKHDVEHREWVAIRQDVALEEREEKRYIRLDEEELGELVRLFSDIVKLIEKKRLIEAIEAEFCASKQKEDYLKVEEYYFLQIYKFVKAYEQILRNLLEKEKSIAHIVKKEGRKIK